jgi:DNA-binding transcriptional ArsR family regulator
MSAINSPVSIQEQLKNSKFIVSVANQPIVFTTMEQIVDSRRSKPGSVPITIAFADEVESQVGSNLRHAGLRALPPKGSSFTASDLVSRMKADGFRFNSKNPRDTVGQLIRRMIRDGLVELERKGTGGEQNLYKRLS